MESDTGLSLPRGVVEPIPRALLRLALPVLASQVLRVAYQWVDALWVRGLGVEATAAVTTSAFVLWWVFALNDIISIGMTAYVSQLLGSGSPRRAGVAARKGLTASLALGLAVAAAGAPLAGPIYRLLGASPAVAHQGELYLRVILLGAPFPMLALTAECVMRAAGNTRVPFWIDLCAVALNAALAPLFIYGAGPVPAMGVAGAALATVASQGALVAGYALMAARRHPAFPLARRADGPPVRLAGMTRVGVPASLIGMLFSVVYVFFSRAASAYGAAALAVVGIVNRVESLEYLAAVAIGTAGSALLGQNLGAGKPERAEAALRTGAAWACVAGLAFGAVLALAPHFFLGLFTRDPEAHRVGAPYLRVLALCVTFNCMEIAVAEAVLGSGHTRMVSGIFTAVSLLRIALALAVPAWTHWGVLGIAWVISLTCIVRSVIILSWAARGSWKTGLGSELGAVALVPDPPEAV